MGHTVINGDLSDLRHLDARNVVVGLSPKGNKAKRDGVKLGFVVALTTSSRLTKQGAFGRPFCCPLFHTPRKSARPACLACGLRQAARRPARGGNFGPPEALEAVL